MKKKILLGKVCYKLSLWLFSICLGLVGGLSGLQTLAQSNTHGIQLKGNTASTLSNRAVAERVHTPHHGYRFTENKGQWHENIHYKTKIQCGELLFENQGFTYLFYRPDLLTKIHGEQLYATHVKFDGHVYKTHFIGSNSQPKIIASKEFGDYENFFIGQDKSKWKSYVKSYQELNYQNLYEGIDLKIYVSENNFEKNSEHGLNHGIPQLKYDFIISPGANPDQILTKYSGPDKLYIKDGRLHIKTSVNEIIEHIPVAYQDIAGKRTDISCEYRLKNDSTVCFYFENGYDTRYPLVIDPVLVFSTYTGSFDDNWGMTAAFDDEGNLYSGGVILNMGDYPASPGAFQGFYGGGATNFGNFNTLGFWCDIAIIKYNATGTNRVYATYLGGKNNELPTSVIVNKNKELWVLGITRSNNFPVSATAYDKTMNGAFDPRARDDNENDVGDIDIVVTKFNSDCSDIIGSTYVGGSGWDGVTKRSTPLYYFYADDSRGEIILDPADNAYIISNTASPDFPTTPNAVKRNLSGSQDAVIFKLNRDLSVLEWSTYFGGNGFDAGYNIEIDENGDLYFSGGTTSSNLPTSASANQRNYAGGRADGYIFQIKKDGSALLNGSYVGTSNYDQCYFIELDDDQNVYFVGHTLGGMPSFGSPINLPTGRQFLKKMNKNLSADLISFRFGSPVARSSPEIAFTAFLVDMCENIYVAGWGGPNFPGSGSTLNLPLTPNAIQPVSDGSDFYLTVFSKDAQSLLYGTYFGGNRTGDHVDGGTSRFDKYGIMYHSVCASCTGNLSLDDFPTTPGAWSRTNNAANCNNASFKFNFQILDATIAEYKYDTITTAGCVPFIVNFTNQSIGAESYKWDFGDGSPISTDENPTHTYTIAGVYPVKLVAINNNKCNKSDTTVQFVYVYAPAKAKFTTDLEPCSFTVKVNNTTSGGTTYTWDFGDGIRSTQYQPDPHTYTTPGTYNVLLIVNTNSYCLDSLIIPVRIDPQPLPDYTIFQDPCAPIIRFTNTTIGGGSYIWDFGDGTPKSTDENPVHTYATAGTYQIKLIANPNTSCIDSITKTIDVIDNSTIAGSLSQDASICFGSKSTLIEIRGQRGRVIRWEISKDQGTNWSSLGKANLTQYQSGSLTVETWFRAVVQNNDCNILNTEPVKMKIINESYGGVLTGGDQKLCGQPANPKLILTEQIGNIMHWEKSTNEGLTWETINHTSNEYIPGIIPTTTWFRVLIGNPNGNCKQSYSSISKITIQPKSIGGKILNDATVCFGSTSPIMTLNNQVGQVTMWQISKDKGNTWTSIGKAGQNSYQSGHLTVTTWFRAIVKFGDCVPAVSEVVKINVLPDLITGNILGAQTICGFKNKIVLQLIGNNTPQNQWESSTDGNLWNHIIGGSDVKILTINDLTQTTHYRVRSSNNYCIDKFTPIATVTIVPEPEGGILSEDHTICFGNRSNVIRLTNYDGSITRWEISKNGTNWYPLGKSGESINQSGALTVNTWFRVAVDRAGCKTAYSNSIKVTVEKPIERGILSGNTSICAGKTPPTLMLTNTNASVSKWQSSKDGSNWNDISETSYRYTPANLTETTLYRVQLINPTCGSLFTEPVTITVINAPTSSGTISGGNKSVCKGDPSGILTLENYSGKIIDWEYSSDGGATWQKFDGNQATNSKDDIIHRTLFRVKTKSLECGDMLISPEVFVDIFPDIFIGNRKKVISLQPQCYSLNKYEFSYPDAIGQIFKWQIKSGNSNTITDLNNTNTVLTLENLIDTVSVRAIYGNAACGTIEGDWMGVRPPSGLSVNISSSISCGSNGKIQATAVGGKSPYEYFLNTTPIRRNSTGIFDDLPPGSYTIQIKDKYDCTLDKNVDLTLTLVKPVIKTVRSVTTSSAIVEWEGDPASPVPSIRYTLRYRIFGTTTWTEIQNISTTQYYISGLQNNTHYEVSVSSNCIGMDGNVTTLTSDKNMIFQTKAMGECTVNNPAYPGGVYVDRITAHDAVIHWSPIRNLQNYQGYIVSYGLPNLAPNTWLQAVVCHPDTFLNMTNLQPNTKYRVHIRTNCTNCTTALKATDNRSAWTQIIEYETLFSRKDNQNILSNYSENTQYILYPNPNQGSVIIFRDGFQENASVYVYDLTGRAIWKANFYTENSDLAISTSDWAAGMYFLKIITPDKTHILRLIKE